MHRELDRRRFCEGLGAALALGVSGAGPLHSAPARRLKVGHTGITWGFKPDDAPGAIKDVASLGYSGYETFGEYLDAWELKGGMRQLLDAANLPLISAYCNVNLTDRTRRKDEVERIVRWSRLIQKAGGVTAVIGPNGVKRPSYDFAASKADIISALNEICKAATDAGVTAALHQHTGTCIEKRDEVYAVLDSVDTRVVKFGPDVGQLKKGGSDPVQVVKDHLSLIRHVHLKDWSGGADWLEYCPLGRGKVDVPGVLALLEKAPDMKIVMVELDPSRNPPMTPLETAAASKEYLKSLGYTFRS
jgi:inosose dehydratase